ncbi:MAG TPA: hypothetical protein VMV29_12890 [Ktedonobacterales bacterium]|nr:hypothetical protein [Ktedonobacterales bacterium]
MPMSYGGAIFSGQRYFTQTQDAYFPTAVGVTSQVSPSPVPNVVPSGNTAVGGRTATVPTGPWYDPRSSGVPMLLIFLGVSLVMLWHVHFKPDL